MEIIYGFLLAIMLVLGGLVIGVMGLEITSPERKYMEYIANVVLLAAGGLMLIAGSIVMYYVATTVLTKL